MDQSASLLAEFDAAAAAMTCQMLSSPARLRLLIALRDGERCVGDLCRLLGRKQTNLSHELNLLFRAGMVRRRRASRFIYYTLARPPAPGELLAAGPIGIRRRVSTSATS